MKKLCENCLEKVNCTYHEKELDQLALNEMIPEKLYYDMLYDKSNREKIAKENKIPLCFFYTRLAMEGRIPYSSEEYLEHIEKIS